MAIGLPRLLTANVSNVTTRLRTTKSCTPTAGRMVIVQGYARQVTPGSPAPTLTLTNTHAVAWSPTRISVSQGSNNRHTQAIWYGIWPSGAGAGSFKLATDMDCNRWGWIVIEVPGPQAALGQSITGVGTTTSSSVTLAGAPASDSMVMGFMTSVADSDGVTPGSGFTPIFDSAGLNLTDIQAQYKAGPAGAVLDWSGCQTTANLMIAIELVAAVVAVPRSVRARISIGDTNYQAVGSLGLDAGLHLVEVVLDQAANRLSVAVDGGAAVNATTVGTFNAQSGTLYLGAPIVNGVVQSDADEEALAYFGGYDAVLTGRKLASARRRAGQVLAPQVVNGIGAAIDVGGATIAMAPYVNNPLGDTRWSIVSVAMDTDGAVASIGADRSVVISSITAPIGSPIAFTVTVANDLPAAYRAPVSFTVRGFITGGESYANGYFVRHRIAMPAGIVGASLTNFPLLFDSSEFADLKETLKGFSNGGAVFDNNGWDIRFEIEGGTKLKHEIISYDGATGVCKAWVKIPTVNAGAATRLLIYAGNASVVATEEDAPGVWTDYVAVWDARTGIDRSGNGRHLTPTSVGAATLLGDCGDYDGVASTALRSYANISAWWGPWSALTLQLVTQLDSDAIGSSRGWVLQGSTANRATDAGLAFYHRPASAAGLANPLFFNVGTNLALADGDAYVISAANKQSNQPTVYHCTWASGEVPNIWANGVVLDKDVANSKAAAGSAVATLNQPLQFGEVPTNNNFPASGKLKGLMDEVRLRAAKLSVDWIALEGLNYLSPSLVYGVGGADHAYESNAAPTGAPVHIACTVGTPKLIDIVAGCYDPDLNAALLITDAGSPSSGTATIVSNLVSYTATVAGVVTWQATVSDGQKSTVCTIRATASGSGGPGPTGAEVPATGGRAIGNLTDGQLTSYLAGTLPGNLGNLAGDIVTLA